MISFLHDYIRRDSMKKLLCALLIIASLAAASCGSIVPKTAEFRRGVIENNVYESELAGVRFSPGPAWKFIDEAGFLNVNGLDSSLAGDEKAIADKLNKMTTVFDMTAEDEHAGVFRRRCVREPQPLRRRRGNDRGRVHREAEIRAREDV